MEWIKNRYIDFVGRDVARLQRLESISQPVLQGCRSSLDWPRSFPYRLTVILSNVTTPQVIQGRSGIVRVELPVSIGEEAQGYWIAKGLLTQFGLYQGIEAPPPDWLIQSVRIRGAINNNTQKVALIRRELNVRDVPSLSDCLETAAVDGHPGWAYLVYQFLESGGMSKSAFQRRLVQYWKNGYDWRQLSVFFDERYPDLNPAELELLWRTFLGESLSSDGAICFSEEASMDELDRISRLEIYKGGNPVVLPVDVWYLYRGDPAAIQSFRKKQGELEAVAVSVHPYYFNACHSLDQALWAIEREDLEAFQNAARQFTQDMLDAQQLSFETDRLMEQLCR